MRVAPVTVLALALCARSVLAQTPAGPELAVNTYTTGRQLQPAVAVQPNGTFVVVWHGTGPSGNYDISGQRFDAAGQRLGGEFTIGANTTAFQWMPAVAATPNGGFVVVWTDRTNDANGDVHGQRFDAVAQPLGAEFIVNQFTTGRQLFAEVGVAGDGGFVVTWASRGGDLNGSGVSGRRYDRTGAPLTDEFVVNSYTTFDQYVNDVAVARDGSFVVAWESNGNRDGSGSAIFAQRFAASGAPAGAEFRVNTFTTGQQTLPSVSMGPAGEFVIVWPWTDSLPSMLVFGQRYDAAGAPLGAEFVVPSLARPGYSRLRDVAHDSTGNFVVAWMAFNVDGSSFGVFGQRFRRDGFPRGSEFRINTYTTSDQGYGVVRTDPAGNIVAAWASNTQDGSAEGIYAQRFGGLHPSALVVDASAGASSDGNRMFEPGETVVMAPAWLNINGAAQTFGGQLSNFTGPAGAGHGIPDTVADYGTVPNGVAGDCGTACYSVAVSNPPVRPVQHWDGTVDEDLTPVVVHGQGKRWTLHIGASFTDVPRTSPFYRFTETLLHRGVTGGCGGTEYCPAVSTTREQMAPFVLLAKEGTGYVPPACTAPLFTDVPASSPFCRWIEELARRGVVNGCGPGLYCPTAPVTREQMAVFVLRTLDSALSPPACTTPMFSDVPAASPYCRWIEELARRGVVTGCGGGNYCPTNPVTREQMAVFLSVTFGLSLYGP